MKNFSVVKHGVKALVMPASGSKHKHNSCCNKKYLFIQMFKDGKIAEIFTFGSTKCSYIINFGIGPYFQSSLDQALKEAPYLVCSFDESYNSTIKKGQMDTIVRFWDNSTNMVSTRYYNSKFLGKAAAVDVHSIFQSCANSVDARKLIQVFLDFFLSFSVIW